MALRATDIGALWRPTAMFGVLCTVVFVARMAVDTLAPRDIVGVFAIRPGGVPVALPILVIISTVPGTLGAMFGRGVASRTLPA